MRGAHARRRPALAEEKTALKKPSQDPRCRVATVGLMDVGDFFLQLHSIPENRQTISGGSEDAHCGKGSEKNLSEQRRDEGKRIRKEDWRHPWFCGSIEELMGHLDVDQQTDTERDRQGENIGGSEFDNVKEAHGYRTGFGF